MEFLTKPWDHQLKAINLAASQRDFALFFEQGTGKTGTTINILRYRYAKAGRVMRTLILGPKIVVNNWKREFAMHSKVNPLDIVPLLGTGQKRVHTFKRHAKRMDETLTNDKIFITNYEAMNMAALYELIRQWNPEIIVCDEAHRLKSPESKRAKKVIMLADQSLHNYALTGTPILNSALDIFNQYRILDRGATFQVFDKRIMRPRPMNYYEFRANYFEDKNRDMPAHVRFPDWVPRPDTYEELNKKIYSKAMRVLSDECMDLPPLIRQVVEVGMSEEQAKMYKEMKDEFITFVRDHEGTDEPRAVVAQMAITKALRLQQIVSGFCKTACGEIVSFKDHPRKEALRDILEDTAPAHKVIVWANFQENYAQIREVCESLKLKYVEIHGQIKDKDEAERAYRQDADVRVMIANPKAGGIGINLVEDASIVKKGQRSFSLFYSKGFSLADYLQAIKRNHRGGSEVYENVTMSDFVCRGTIDELVMEALEKKQDISTQVLDWKDKV